MDIKFRLYVPEPGEAKPINLWIDNAYMEEVFPQMLDLFGVYLLQASQVGQGCGKVFEFYTDPETAKQANRWIKSTNHKHMIAQVWNLIYSEPKTVWQ